MFNPGAVISRYAAAESKLTLVDGEPVIGEKPMRLTRLKARAEKATEEVVSLQESVEAKEALLARAVDENEVNCEILWCLFCALFNPSQNPDLITPDPKSRGFLA